MREPVVQEAPGQAGQRTVVLVNRRRAVIAREGVGARTRLGLIEHDFCSAASVPCPFIVEELTYPCQGLPGCGRLGPNSPSAGRSRCSCFLQGDERTDRPSPGSRKPLSSLARYGWRGRRPILAESA